MYEKEAGGKWEEKAHFDFLLFLLPYHSGVIREEDRRRFGPRLQAEAARAAKLGFTDRATSMKLAYDELAKYSNAR